MRSTKHKKSKFLTVLFLIIGLNIIPNLKINQANAEIIDIKQEENEFGDWKVFCETDLMMAISHCKIASKFYQNTAVITIEPAIRFLNQLHIVIPQIRPGTFLKIRVDQGNLILSNNISTKDFGLIPLDEKQKVALYNQMKSGDFLYLRFNVRDSDKEITARISLKDFRKALDHYRSKASK